MHYASFFSCFFYEVKGPTPSKDLLNALKEIDYMKTPQEEYKSFHSIKELMEDLNSDN